MATIYCNKEATGLNDGSSWENAFTSLNSAFVYANANPGTVINIDGSEYILSPLSFTFIQDTEIIGGFNPFNKVNHPLYTKITLAGLTISANIIIKFSNIEFDSIASYIITDSSTSNTTLNNIIHNGYGLASVNGTLLVDNSVVNSIGANIVTVPNANVYISSSFMKSTTTSIFYNSNCTISKSTIYADNTGLSYGVSTNNNTIKINDSLIKATNNGIVANNVSNIYIIDSTIDANTSISATNTNNVVNVVNSILLGNTNITTPSFDSENTAYINMPISVDSSNIQLTKRPTFKNESEANYTPMFGVGENLETFELTVTNSSYIQNVNAQVFKNIPVNLANYRYLVNNIFVISDYMKEYKFGYDMFNYYNDDYVYTTNYKKEVIKNDLIVASSFPYSNVSGAIPSTIWPYEWDYKPFDDGTINGLKYYIVPRSIIDITDTINFEFMFDPSIVSLSTLETIAIKESVITGIGYDYTNSSNTKILTWTLNTDYQLTAKNLYNNEYVAQYNLFSKPVPSEEHYFIQPSGLIPFGRTNDGYIYQLEYDPNIQIKGVDEYFNFEWMPTDKTPEYDLRGLVVYKDNLYVTGKYTIDNSSVIICYPAKGNYTDYIGIPKIISIGNDDQTFTDLTVLEDGSFLLASDNSQKLFNYIPNYDYAKISGSNKTETTLILKEDYDNIVLSGVL